MATDPLLRVLLKKISSFEKYAMISINYATRWNSVVAINLLELAIKCIRGLKNFMLGGNTRLFQCQLAWHRQGDGTPTNAATSKVSGAIDLKSL